jgi:hypothetical protein
MHGIELTHEWELKILWCTITPFWVDFFQFIKLALFPKQSCFGPITLVTCALKNYIFMVRFVTATDDRVKSYKLVSVFPFGCISVSSILLK